MPSSLERFSSNSPMPRPLVPGLSRRSQRALTNLEERTLVRVAAVQAEGYVATEKTRELDHLARDAMTGQAMLARWAQTLAASDPFIADELKPFSDLARIGKAEIMANLVDEYCRESRR